MASSPLLDHHFSRILAEVNGEDLGSPEEVKRAYDSRVKPAHRKDPVLWARERLGTPLKRWRSYHQKKYHEHVWDGTMEPLASAATALAQSKSAAVSSATGVGKTYWAAIIVLWWLDCFHGAQVVTVAPKKEQLTQHVWKEIGRLWPLFKKLHPQATLLDLQIRMRGKRDWGAVGYPVGVAALEEVAGRMRGFHAEHLLFILEETPNIDPAIINAIEFTCTAPHNLRLYLGNPDSDQDQLAIAMKSPGVVPIRASALDHPNIVCDDPNLVPGATSRMKIDEWAEKWGEDSALYQSRARGIAPAQGKHSLIRMEWLKAAAERAKTKAAELSQADGGHGALGCDIANSEHGDPAAIAYGRGRLLIEVRNYSCPDANAFARQEIFPFIDSGMVRSAKVGIDVVGVGVGAYNELKRLGVKDSQPLQGGQWDAYCKDGEEFVSLRAQMYWQLRNDLQKGLIGLPEDAELFADLTAPTWEARNSKIAVEAKEHLIERLKRSPNKGDAVVYWNWVRQARKTLSFVLPPGHKALGPLNI